VIKIVGQEKKAVKVMEQIKVTIAGPRGRMGKEAVELVQNTPHFTLISVIDHKGEANLAVPVYKDIAECFRTETPHVLIDLTTPEVGYLHTKTALEYGVRPVVGTTGFTPEELNELKELAESTKLGCIIAPNFAIGAVLMMKFSQMAAKYFDDIEIIELHHDQKLDAPSGTAVKTAEMIKEVREAKTQGHPNEKETHSGARGATIDGMHIHSVRLPGLIAHQQVMFGAEGETLTVRHDSFNRASFMSGVKVSVDTVMRLDTLVYGLENILD
jgi:4-hydroxy-tetrahydrodipicolinate reductase